MLVENKKSIAAGEVVVLKPLTGADIIGRLSREYFFHNSELVAVTKLLEAHVVQDKTSVGLAFMPFSMTARDDQVFTFSVDKLLVQPFLARDEVKKSYQAQTSSLVM